MYGAKVIATVSSDEKAHAALASGADHVVNYKTSGDTVKEILDLTGGRGVDRITEMALAANFELDAAVLAAGGTITAYGSAGNFSPTFPFIPLMFKAARVRSVSGFGPSAENLREIRRALTEGKLKPRIWKRYALDDIAHAHEDQDANRSVGKIVIQIAD
jgi:NADPH2:quinone reductase